MKQLFTIIALAMSIIGFSQSPSLPGNVSMPVYPGGDMGLLKDVNSQLQYPESEIDSKVEGKVFVGFFVEVDGSITDVHVEKGIVDHPSFGDAAIAAVKSLKKFEPAVSNGKPVRMMMTLPVMFKLD